MRISQIVRKFFNDAQAATAIEYALICALIFIPLSYGFTEFSKANDAVFNKVETAVSSAINGSN